MNTRLVAYRGKLTESGCKVNLPGSSYPVSPNETTIAVDTADATTLFKVGQKLVRESDGALYGVIKTVNSATSITLTSIELELFDNSNLNYYPEQEFEMDLDEAPSIVVNYNWIDISDPEKRMGSFSQTIKIPFTDRNNKFFENWFDVNLDTLVFDANTKFMATVYVDTVEQMKGFIQLKSIYLNARQYEIVVFGNSSNFFTAIKDKKLRQAFENVNDAGVITADEQLDHLLNVHNVYNSWNAGLTTINPTTTSNDVMYPIIDYALTPKPLSNGIFVDIMGSGWNWATSEWNASSEWGLTYPTNLKPALRIQRLLQIIAQKAGYTISSTFLGIAQDGTLSDTQWFSRLFMTLANQHERVKTYYSGLGFQVSMAAPLTNQIIYGDQNEESGSSLDDENYIWPMSCIRELGFTNETSPNFNTMDTFSINPETYTTEDGDDWTIQMNTISFPSESVAGELGLVENYLSEVINITVNFNISFPQFGGSHVQWFDNSSGTYRDFDTGGGTAQMMIYIEYSIDAPGSGNDVGWTTFDSSFFIYMYERAEVDNYANDWSDGGLQNIPINRTGNISGITTAGGQVHFRLRFSPGTMGGGYEMVSFDVFKVNINSGMIRTNNTGSAGYTNGGYGMQVVMAENMPDIRQSDFMRDLMNRFNLVILNDAENANNLIIEPYQDYIGGGTTQYWTDKLDVSKEQVVKPTSELQKQEFIFQDKEGGDVLNKHYKEQNELVYGYKRELGGEFASGDGKNFSIFAPFIAQGILKNGPEPWEFYGQSSQGVAIAQMYEVTDEESLGDGRSSITDGVPRLFYYSGTPVGISGNDGVTGDPRYFRIYAPIGVAADTATEEHPQGTFPLCTQYNLDNLDTGITSATKQLLWDWVSPRFKYPWYMSNPFGNSATIKGYYYEQWSQYFNEIYNKEARLMECYLNLTPTDISKFEAEAFKNPVYIKNTLWRVLKIDKYLVGGNQSTKVTLLKVIEKLNWDCDSIPDSYNADGTITFINPATGADTTVTNLCCEQLNESWTFQQTDSDTGVGTCYHNLNIPIVDPGYTGTDFEGLDFGSMMIPMPSDNFVNNQLQRKQRRVFAQASDLLFSTVTIGTTVAYLGYNGAPQGFSMKQKTMAYVEVDLIGTVVKGTFAHIGAVGYFKYYTLLKRKNKVPTHEGSSGGTQVQKIEGTNFPTTPTINLTNINALTGSIQIAITSSSADHTISWVAKVRILSQKLVGLDGENVYRDFALYQNYSNILFENTDFLEWN